jgi:hypothetical protein
MPMTVGNAARAAEVAAGAAVPAQSPNREQAKQARVPQVNDAWPDWASNA